MKRINLLHLITTLEPAGAENLLVSIVRKLDKKRFRTVVGYIYGEGTLAPEIRERDIKVINLSRKGRIDPLLIIRIFLLIRKERIEIIHTHLVHASIAGRIAAKLAGVKVIVSTRHYTYYHSQNRIVNWLERKTAVLNNRIIAISNAVKEHLQERENYQPETISVINNAVDLDCYPLVKEEIKQKGDCPLSSDCLLIGSVGRLHPSKGYDTLLNSIPEVIAEFPSAKFMIIGDGAQKEYLQKLCVVLGISEYVVFLGGKAHDQVLSFFKRIHLFVLTSNWEGFGIAAIEAMASGKPVVATNVEGLREVVKDGRTGFLVPPGQPKALAKKIILLLKNPSLCSQMGNEGRKRVETLFSLDGMINELESLYLALIK